MKNFTIIVIAVLFSLKAHSQTENINTAKYHPAKEIFETKYDRILYAKIPGNQINVFDDSVVIQSITVEIKNDTDVTLKRILINGLLHPNQFYGIPCCLSELKLLNPNPQTKRFKFWTFPKKIEITEENKNSLDVILSNRINPDEYYFELYNENASEDTNLEEFIDNATLTFFAYGGGII